MRHVTCSPAFPVLRSSSSVLDTTTPPFPLYINPSPSFRDSCTSPADFSRPSESISLSLRSF